MNYQGDFIEASSIYVYFNTFDSNDPSASVTMTGLAVTDIEIYKNGSTTQRSSDSGYALLDTDGIDFDSLTGIHGFSVDLSDDADTGFFAAGNEYVIVIASMTVDSATVNFIAATFSIERTGGAIATAKLIKTVTDKFVFTVSNQVDSNVESINATAMLGVGTSGNKWRA